MSLYHISALVVGALLLSAPLVATAEDELARTEAWTRPELESVRQQTLALLQEKSEDEQIAAQADELWAPIDADTPATEILAAVAQSIALVDPRANELVAYCSQPGKDYHPPEYAWLREEGVPPMLGNNLRLYYARWLAQYRYYDESLIQIADLQPEDVVDPATLLFLQGLNGHRLLNKEIGLKALGELFKNEAELPQRYVVLAGLMKSDLENMEDESLNHISRQMEDVERRLTLGRAGKTVQIPEEEALNNLDKLIEELEKQRQQMQQQQSGGAPGDNIQSSSPAQDSLPMGGKGPGEVDRKDIGSSSGWGDLPPKEREKTLQDIGRDFPSHYRDAIEEFFREQAKLRRD